MSLTDALDRRLAGEAQQHLGARRQLTKVVAEALAVETPVMVPRVPAIDEYMDVLAEAVRAAEPG